MGEILCLEKIEQFLHTKNVIKWHITTVCFKIPSREDQC